MPCSHFQTTRWTLVMRAASGDSQRGREALAEMLEGYWYPLYFYLRRQDYDVHQAEDLLQGFVLRMLEKGYLANVISGRGRFRNFLLVSLRNYLASDHERTTAQKRGGRAITHSLDIQAAEGRYQADPAHELTAERLFDRAWALGLLEQSLARLAEAWRVAGKGQQLELLKSYLVLQSETISYRDAAEKLGLTEGAIKTAVHRLRTQFRHILCDLVASTLDREELLEDEIRRLFAALRL
jgi:RNA polymerase sigma factor (sigma-70 family)